MKRLFSYEGPVSQGIGKILDFLLLSVLWLVFSLPVITVGGASAALYYTARKVLRRDIGHVTKEFLRCFRGNFRQATVLWLILLGVLAFLAGDIWLVCGLCRSGILHRSVLYLLLVLAALVLTWGQFLFSYLSRFSDSTAAILRNCIRIVLSNPLAALGIAALLAAALFFLWDIPGGILLVPAGVGLLCGRLTDRVFQKYMSRETLEEDRESGQFRDFS